MKSAPTASRRGAPCPRGTMPPPVCTLAAATHSLPSYAADASSGFYTWNPLTDKLATAVQSATFACDPGSPQ